MKWRAALANTLWIGSSLPAWKQFRQALGDPAPAQERLLLQMLRAHARSAYGRSHGFAEIHAYREFARRVPLMDGASLEPWTDRLRRGEAAVLSAEPATHLIPTSGTSGGQKLIPFTAGLQQQFDRAIGPWMTDLAIQHPGILSGPAYWSVTPVLKPASPMPSAVPIGFADDASYLGGLKGWLVRSAMAVPGELGSIQNLRDFHLKTWLHLLRERDLRLISAWHPSFFILLLDALPGLWEQALTVLHARDRGRAGELSRIGPGEPSKFWPRLQLISCWGSGHAEWGLRSLSRRFPGAALQPKGLLATEGVVTLPFGGRHPLAVLSHFFEFIDEAGEVHLAGALREGNYYEAVMTTAGGLWRYRLGDRVVVDGFAGRTPSLRFAGRTGGVSDLCGEKLDEEFVAAAIRQTVEACGMSLRFMLLAPDPSPAGLGYTFYAEGVIDSRAAAMLDAAFRANPHYAYCRDLGQLQSVRIFEIARLGWETYARRVAAAGTRAGDLKPGALSREDGWADVFQGHYIGPQAP